MAKKKAVWTQFMDMHSGGGQKEDFSHCYIEAPEEEAKVIFYNRFGHNPDRVTCTCCGSDYSISENESLEQASGYERHCAYDDKTNKYLEKVRGHGRGPYRTLAEYIALPTVHVIYAKDIKDEERTGEVPEQGYVWQ